MKPLFEKIVEKPQLKKHPAHERAAQEKLVNQDLQRATALSNTDFVLTKVVETLMINTVVRIFEGLCVAFLHLLLDKPDDRVQPVMDILSTDT